DQRGQFAGVAVGGQQSRQRSEAHNVQSLPALQTDLDTDHRGQQRRDQYGTGRDREQTAAEGDVGDQSRYLTRVAQHGGGQFGDRLGPEQQQATEPAQLFAQGATGPSDRAGSSRVSGSLFERSHSNTGGAVTRKICVITRLTMNRDTPETTTERLTASPTPVGPFSQFSPWKLATTAAMTPNTAALR